MKTRFVNYDCMRVISCIFVIMIHVPDKPFSFPVRVIYTTVFFLSNGIFYMLSGKFNIEHTYSGSIDFLNYYRKKFIAILFPYACISFFLSAFNLYHETGKTGAKSLLRFAYTEFMSTNSTKALWFLYPLIGFLVTAPFLSKMVHAMSVEECRLMVGVAIIWNIIKVYLTSNIGIPFGFSGWFLETWILYFTMGYLVDLFIDNKNRKILYVLGIAGFLFTVSARIITHEHFEYTCDHSPAFFFFTIAAYDFMKQLFMIKNTIAQKAVSFIAQHTFIIYLLHIHVMRYVVPNIVKPDTKTVPGYLLEVACIFVCSLSGAIILRALIIRPLQSLLKKIPILRLGEKDGDTV